MTTEDQIRAYIDGQPEPKRSDLDTLHTIMLRAAPHCRLWFLDGRNDAGKTVSNPSIGYGSTLKQYVNGTSAEFYRIGVSANTTGLSVYILGTPHRDYLAQTYGGRLGRAKVTGYCVTFRSLKDVNADVLTEAMQAGLTASG